MSEYYDHTTFPSYRSSGSSAAVRAEFDKVEAGFDKLPVLSGNANKAVVINTGGGGLTTTTGTLALAGNLVKTGSHLFSFSSSGVANVTFPTTGTLATLAGVESLTNKTLSTPTVSGSITLNGGQIQFPAAQSASSNANTLDDYEEGTWTPSVGGTATYTVQVGLYTKIGRTVFFNISLQINVLGTGSTFTISGLPFTVSGSWGGAYCGIYSGLATAVATLYVELPDGNTTVLLQGNTASPGTESTGTSTLLTNSTSVTLSGFYMASA